MRKEWQTVEKEIQTWEVNSYCTTQETTDQSELEFAVVNIWSVCWNWFDNKFCTMKSVKYFQKLCFVTQWHNQPCACFLWLCTENFGPIGMFVSSMQKKYTHEKSTIKCWISSNKIGCSPTKKKIWLVLMNAVCAISPCELSNC